MIVTWFKDLNPIIQALLATCFTWLVTAMGAGLVFFFKSIKRKVLDLMLGFAAGVMIAASFWSLLSPAIALAEESGVPAYIPALVGFLLGGLFLWIGPAFGEDGPPCDPVSGSGDTNGFYPPTGPCGGGPGFEGPGILVVRGEELGVWITTCLLGEPVPGDDGTLHGVTSHTFTFDDGSGSITTTDNVVLEPTEVPGVFRLNSNMEITSGSDDFADAGGRLHGHGEINLIPGFEAASFEINGVICD